MGFQTLAGITVTQYEPKGKAMIGNGQVSRAFGGWIFNATMEAGTSQTPTSITLDIALDIADGYSANAADFGITKDDLNVSRDGGNNVYYKIQFGGKIFKPMFLVSYNISGSAETKSLSVKFVDYSIILDKIQICLFKKQDYKKEYLRKFGAEPALKAYCPSCQVTNEKFYKVTIPAGEMKSKVEGAAYFYNHQNTNGKNLFDAYGGGGSDVLLPAPDEDEEDAKWPYPITVPPMRVKKYDTYKAYYQTLLGTLFKEWNNKFDPDQRTPDNSGGLDINGGTIVLGTEEFNQSVCGAAAQVTYNFTELICVLAKAGLTFSQINSDSQLLSAGPIEGKTPKINKNKNYRKDYTGTLREVLNNWCADFALDFYMDGVKINFVDLTNNTDLETDIDELMKVANPNSSTGMDANSDKDYALGDFTESMDLADTFGQGIVTFKIKPKRVEERSNQRKDACAFLAMHPLDLMEPDMTRMSSTNMHGKTISRPIFCNKIWGGQKKIWRTNRLFETVDMCAAIGKYSKMYRDIYASQLCIDKERGMGGWSENEGFNSFAFRKIYRLNGVSDSDVKLELIEKLYKKEDKNNSQYILDPSTFEVYVGFRNNEEYEDIISWENTIAENMYKHGVLVKGPKGYDPDPPSPTKGPPTPGAEERFVPDNFATQKGLTAGLDEGSMKLLKLETNTTPAFSRYRFYEDIPFKDLFTSSLNFFDKVKHLRELPFAQLDNEWGTDPKVFDALLRVDSPGSCNNHGDLGTAGITDGEVTPDSFSVADFVPKFMDLSDDFFEDGDFGNLQAVIAKSPFLGIILNTTKQNGGASYTQVQCPKLQIMIVPRMRVGLAFANPHLSIKFEKKANDNLVHRQAEFKRIYNQNREMAQEFLPSVCDFKLEDMVCNVGVAAGADCKNYSVTETDCKCVTPLNVQPNRDYQTGFPMQAVPGLFPFPARAILITINVHPFASDYTQQIVKPTTGGGVAFCATDEDFPTFIRATKQGWIVYPRQSDSFNGSGVNDPKDQPPVLAYRGVITQNASFQLRNSETIECHQSHWMGTTNVMKAQLINNEIPQEIDQMVDPDTKAFIQTMYDSQGDEIKSIKDYHDLIKDLSNETNDKPMRSIDFKIIGNVLTMPSLIPYLFPHKGLKSLSFSLGDGGFTSNLKFANRAKVLPKAEAIMNKVRPVF